MPRVKKCITCKQEIPEPRPFRKTCSPQCLIEYARGQEKKKRRKEKLRWKEDNKTKPELIKEAQTEFNKYIRARDHDKPCISCGRYDHEIPDIYTGGKWDCGHFLSVGAFPELRFTEINAHKQCKADNAGSGKYTRKNYTVSKEYEERLIERIGQEKVDWLKGPHDQPNWTHDEIRAIKQTYKDKTKALK